MPFRWVSSSSRRAHWARLGQVQVVHPHRMLHPTLMSDTPTPWAGMLSIDGRSKTFDARANGYARGEGLGAHCLRRDTWGEAPTALRLLSGAVHHNGRAASLTAPNGSAQRTLLLHALERSALGAADVPQTEAHGTGTALGDPTEIRALLAVHEPAARTAPLLVGANKASNGHSDGPAGMDGMLKVVRQIDSVFSGNAHLRVCNPIARDSLRTHCMLPTQSILRSAGDVKRTGLSSFGFSGTISHVMLGRRFEDSSVGSRLAPARVYRRKAYNWVSPPHPFLHSSPHQTARVSCSVAAIMPYVADHVLNGRVIFPVTCSHPSSLTSPPHPGTCTPTHRPHDLHSHPTSGHGLPRAGTRCGEEWSAAQHLLFAAALLRAGWLARLHQTPPPYRMTYIPTLSRSARSSTSHWRRIASMC